MATTDGEATTPGTSTEQEVAFGKLSALLTGYDRLALAGTGRIPEYLATVAEAVGEELTTRLLGAGESLASGQPSDDTVKEKLLDAEDFGPLCRNIIKMWFVGVWYALDQDWFKAHGTNAANDTKVVSSDAYVEGLVWRDMGSHPQAAKQPGWATWAWPPLSTTGDQANPEASE